MQARSVRDYAKAAGFHLPPTLGDPDGQARLWSSLREARAHGTPIGAQLLHVSSCGAFLLVANGIVGFAPVRELPPWVSRDPRVVQRHRQIRCAVTAIGSECGGDLFLSPRLAALHRTIEATNRYERVTGIVRWTCLAAVAVDLDGETGFAIAPELSPDAVRQPPSPGAEWSGYVAELGQDGVLLSEFSPTERADRATARDHALAEVRAGLVEGQRVAGQMSRVERHRGIVSILGGVLWGLIEHPRLSVMGDGASYFSVLGLASEYHTGAHLELALPDDRL